MRVLQTQVQVGCIIHSGSHFGNLRTELLVPVIRRPCIVSLLRQVFRFSLALPGLLSASSSHSFRYVKKSIDSHYRNNIMHVSCICTVYNITTMTNFKPWVLWWLVGGYTLLPLQLCHSTTVPWGDFSHSINRRRWDTQVLLSLFSFCLMSSSFFLLVKCDRAPFFCLLWCPRPVCWSAIWIVKQASINYMTAHVSTLMYMCSSFLI